MKILIIGATALAFLTGSAAFAQRYDARDARPDYADRDRRGGASQSWREGGQVPYDLMVGGKNIHYQWRQAGLNAPPPGYAWMKFGQQYFLADQKSGLIREVRGVDEGRGRGTRSRY